MVHPVSRGRNVRFEIPEVPPPPSSPQLSDDAEKEQSRNTVTINTNVPQMSPPSVSSNKPMSEATIRTNATTINTTLQGENSFVRLNTAPVRETSFISSPEPWPQINEADYDVAPLPSPVSTLHETIQISETMESELKSEAGTQSGNAQEEVDDGEEKREPSPEMEKDSEYVNKTEDQSAVVKKMMEESRKTESPAPPPPSPEAKEDSDIIINKHKSIMTPLMEEVESMNDNEISMTVMQITPKGPLLHGRKSNQRNLDTFQNIDIPAEFDLEPGHLQLQEPSTATIIEEPEPAEVEDNKVTRDIAPSVQSTLANQTISEQAQSEISSSMVEPAVSQASLGPILSEDSSEKREHSELFGDLTGRVVGSSESQETQAMLNSADKPDMTEDGGDHEGFKEDLRQEYEKLTHEIESTNETSEENNSD